MTISAALPTLAHGGKIRRQSWDPRFFLALKSMQGREVVQLFGPFENEVPGFDLTDLTATDWETT